MNPLDPSSPTPRAQALAHGLRALEALSGPDRPIDAGELSGRLGLPESTVRRLLDALDDEGRTRTPDEAAT